MSKFFDDGNARMKNLFGFAITDFTWYNIKYHPKVRLFLGVVIIIASFAAITFDFKPDFRFRSAETIGQLIGFGIGLSFGIWFIVKRNRIPAKKSGDKVIDDLE